MHFLGLSGQRRSPLARIKDRLPSILLHKTLQKPISLTNFATNSRWHFIRRRQRTAPVDKKKAENEQMNAAGGSSSRVILALAR